MLPPKDELMKTACNESQPEAGDKLAEAVGPGQHFNVNGDGIITRLGSSNNIRDEGDGIVTSGSVRVTGSRSNG